MVVTAGLDTVDRPVIEAKCRVQAVELFDDEVIGLAAVPRQEQRIPVAAAVCVCVCVCQHEALGHTHRSADE